MLCGAVRSNPVPRRYDDDNMTTSMRVWPETYIVSDIDSLTAFWAKLIGLWSAA